MRAFLRPLAVTAVLIVGGLPAVVLACQWACDTPAAAAAAGGHHHGDHHESVAAQTTADVALIPGSGHACDHSPLLEVGVITPTVQLFAPAAFVVPDARASMTSPNASFAAAPAATSSPPGARSGPLPLRL